MSRVILLMTVTYPMLLVALWLKAEIYSDSSVDETWLESDVFPEVIQALLLVLWMAAKENRLQVSFHIFILF